MPRPPPGAPTPRAKSGGGASSTRLLRLRPCPSRAPVWALSSPGPRWEPAALRSSRPWRAAPRGAPPTQRSPPHPSPRRPTSRRGPRRRPREPSAREVQRGSGAIALRHARRRRTPRRAMPMRPRRSPSPRRRQRPPAGARTPRALGEKPRDKAARRGARSRRRRWPCRHARRASPPAHGGRRWTTASTGWAPSPFGASGLAPRTGGGERSLRRAI
mmetsp:Transcript_26507/g.76431  ORF Transcript_26507/g.76431 Transcript_26507/m.76431 type:complete len:216 (+) Transcript_26507:752-1399(+)